MRNIAIILVILCASLRVAENMNIKPNLKGIISDIGEIGNTVSNSVKEGISDIKEGISDAAHQVIPSCMFGVESVSMLLFTREYPFGKNIGWHEVNDNIDPTKQVYFLVHGFISSANYTNSYLLASSLIEKDYTVFSLDWSDAACTTGLPVIKLLGYPSAVQNTREIGELMAKYIISVIDKSHVPLKNITLIGHSLGAHVSGFAAKNIQQNGYGTIERLIACDPANPLFAINKCENRICKSDAKYLMVLHTTVALGISYDLGHTDYYFDRGYMQPGCTIDVTCSHSRATLYLNTVMEDKCKFPGVPFQQSKWGIEGIFKKPRYPDATTTDCTILDDKIFTVPYYTAKHGSYYIFVESEPTFCTEKQFSCSN